MAGPDVDTSRARGGVGEAVPHDSAELHVSGEAVYTDDILEPRGLLYLAVAVSVLANLEGIAMIALLPEWRPDVRGLVWLLRERRRSRG